MKSLLVLLCLGLQATSVSAHNVVSGIYADGMSIEGEIGFSNGDMAQVGSPVKVYDAQDKLLAELTLVEGGLFSYEAKQVAKHVFKANLSAGHVAEMVIEASELTPSASAKITSPEIPVLADSSTKPKAMAEGGMDSAKSDTTAGINVTVEQLESIVRSAVAQQVRPLQKELRDYKEKVMLRDIAGGLGFIFGLFGVAAWMASRRKQGGKNATVS